MHLVFACRLDALATGDTTSLGQTMNLISNDVERFLLVTAFGPYIIWSPLQAIAVIAVGSISIGPAFCVGAALLIFVIIPLQIMLGRRYAFMRSKVRIQRTYLSFISSSYFLH